MLKVGLTGGLASGKSFIGRVLAERGCVLIQADLLGHRVLLPDGAAYADVLREFGRGVVNADETINRKALAAEVFSRPERLAVLNAIVHPAVYRLEDEMVAAADSGAIVVVEAAILIETGNWRRFDKLIVAVCTREQQIERAMHRDGASLPDVLSRLDRQLPLEEKRKLADYVIDTSGTKEQTQCQTEEVLICLKALARAKIES